MATPRFATPVLMIMRSSGKPPGRSMCSLHPCVKLKKVMRLINQMNLQTRRNDTGLMPSTAKKLAGWGLVMSLCLAGPIFSGATLQSSAAFASEPDTSEKATLRISLKRGAVRGRSGRFEF